jgi:hypothetical protein
MAKNLKSKTPCVICSGLGERDPAKCTHAAMLESKRSAIRAIYDADGRWLIHWREKDGKEWVGTYRLMPC